MTEQEWLAIYRRTVHPLYAFIARRTGGLRPVCEDIVQETYLRALDDWRRKRVPDSPEAWLKRVARNLWVDGFRRNRWLVSSEVEELPDPGGAEDSARSLEIARAVSALGGKRARVVEAFYFDGLSVREIAAEMGVSGKAVEGLLRRSRRSLKALLPETGPEGGHHDGSEPA